MCALSSSQNINQLEIFGDMSTPPDITSPSVSSCHTYTLCDLFLIKTITVFPMMCLSLVFFSSYHNPRRPPPLQPTPSTPRRACSLPRNCLLPSIPRLCPQVRPCSFFCLNTATATSRAGNKRSGWRGERVDSEARQEEKEGGVVLR